jgi:site-specific recombinase XerC
MAGRRSSRAIAPGYHAGRAPGNKGRRYPPEILTVEEVRALIAGCSNRAPTGVRNRALIVVLYRGGLRLEEALGLMARDVDARRGTVNVRHGQGRQAPRRGWTPRRSRCWSAGSRRAGASAPWGRARRSSAR